MGHLSGEAFVGASSQDKRGARLRNGGRIRRNQEKRGGFERDGDRNGEVGVHPLHTAAQTMHSLTPGV